MGNVLFLCHTPFQCLTALSLKLSKFQKDEVDIIITDRMSNSVQLAENFKKINKFENVYHFPIKSIMKAKYKVNKLLNILKYELLPWKLLEKINFKKKYDIFFTYNNDVLAESLLWHCLKRNKKLKICLFDEGYSTYTTAYKRQLFSYKSKKNVLNKLTHILFRRKHISDVASELYLWNPELLAWETPFEVKKIGGKNFEIYSYKQLLNSAFNFDINDLNDLNDIVFFEESFAEDKRPIDDVSILEYLIKYFSKDKMIIKLHPRSTKNRFDELGVKISNNNSIPWEIFAMNVENPLNGLLISYSSSALLSYRIIFDKSIPSILLFDCKDEKNSLIDDESREFFYKFQSIYNKDFYIPKNVDELGENLTEIMRKNAKNKLI